MFICLVDDDDANVIPSERQVDCCLEGMQIAADLRRAWIEGGPKVMVARTLRKLVRPACKVGSLVFIECDLEKLPLSCREASGVVVREAQVEDAHLFSDRERFLRRLRDGHRCFMGIEEATGKLTNYRWMCTVSTYIPELRRYLLLNPDETYVYDLYTLPEFRRRGIDAYTRHWIYSHLRDTGFRKVYAYIHGDNQPSIQASRILLRPIGRIWYLQPRGFAPIVLGSPRVLASLRLSASSHC
jgi:hypothetical protein